MEYENAIEEKICEFKKYVKQTMDLMVDAYRWKEMANECDNEEMRNKYNQVSNTLFELFMVEHENMKNVFSK